MSLTSYGANLFCQHIHATAHRTQPAKPVRAEVARSPAGRPGRGLTGTETAHLPGERGSVAPRGRQGSPPTMQELQTRTPTEARTCDSVRHSWGDAAGEGGGCPGDTRLHLTEAPPTGPVCRRDVFEALCRPRTPEPGPCTSSILAGHPGHTLPLSYHVPTTGWSSVPHGSEDETRLTCPVCASLTPSSQRTMSECINDE